MCLTDHNAHKSELNQDKFQLVREDATKYITVLVREDATKYMTVLILEMKNPSRAESALSVSL